MQKAFSYKSKDFLEKNCGLSVIEKWPSVYCPLHWHEFIEVELVLDGEGCQTRNGKDENLSAGSLTVLLPTDFHCVTPGKDLHLITLSIDDRLLSEEILAALMGEGDLFFTLSPEHTAEIAALLGLMNSESTAGVSNKRYLKHLIFCLFLKILQFTPKKATTSAKLSAPLQSALIFLKMHFRENPSLADAAKIAHYTPSHFSAEFHREMGVTYSAYLNELKLSFAKELLLTTDAKITEVCFESGFTSHSNFLRLFKEDTGLSPKEYRTKA